MSVLVADFYVWTGIIVINLPLPAIYPSGNIYLGFSLLLSLRCLRQSCLTHTETQTQTHTCYPHISKFPQELLPMRATMCLCYSVLQTGCLQQQHPWRSGIVTSSLFNQLLRLPFNGILSSLLCFWTQFLHIILYKNPVIGIFCSFEFVTPPEKISRPSPPQRKLLMFATFADFNVRTNWEIMTVM